MGMKLCLLGVLISLLLLCICIPSAFIFVACASPFIAIAAVLVRVYWKPKSPKSKNVNKVVSVKDDDIIILRNDGTAISRQMSRRRNFRDKNRPSWASRGRRNDASASLTDTNIRDLLGLSPEVEEKPKVLLEDGSNVKEVLVSESLWKKPEFASHSGTNEQQRHRLEGKVEIEDRNKRLEILMAKKRARKLMGLKDGDSPVDADGNAHWPELGIAPISVSKIDHVPRVDTPMPCSAPPFMAPNPFDLPYDPHEERPNFMGDSFHDEFTVKKSKDKFLCRHESFTLGSFFKLEPRKAEQLGYPKGRSMSPKLSTQYHVEEERAPIPERPMSPKGSTQAHIEEEQAPIKETTSVQSQHEEDKEIDNVTTQTQVEGIGSSQNMEPELSKKSELMVKTDTKHTKHRDSSASSSSSASDSSDEDHVYNANIAGVSVCLTPKGRNFPNMIGSPMKRPIGSSIPKKKDDHSLSAVERAKRDEFFYVGRSHHAPSFSLASDMQVELSDDGSPPPMANEAFAIDGEHEKETSSGGEDMRGPSTSVGGSEKQELSSGEVRDSVSETSEKGQPDLEESDESQNVAKKLSSVDNSGKVPTEQSSVVNNLNETLMSQIMNEEKLQSEEHGELESKASSTTQEPVPELLTNVEESSARSVRGNIEGQSQHSSDSNLSLNGEPESQALVDESNSKSTKDIENSSNQSVG